MKKIILLCVLGLFISCSQENLEETQESNFTKEIQLEENQNSSNLERAALPIFLCNASATHDSTGFYFTFADTDAWGNYIHIRPQNTNGSLGIGKMYTINASTGNIFIPVHHGVDLGGLSYIFVTEVMQDSMGNYVTFCGLSYSFN